MDQLQVLLSIAAAVGSGLSAGVFFAFSTFVMPALGRLPPAQGMAAMQAINVAAITPLFMLALFGTGLVSMAVAVEAALSLAEPGAALRLTGGATYVLGAAVVTIACNVPRNNALAAAAPGTAGGDALWAGYRRSWGAWNHVRTVACLAASALLTAALAG